ncbi:MAG: hypothetical protein WC501_02305 [Candidatus Micrarchaeia archaeon]
MRKRVFVQSSRRLLTTRRIASKEHISWLTAKENLVKLKKNRYMENKDLGNRVYWWIKKDE